MPVLSSYEMDTPVHFALPNALRFEITEHALADDRRHGWSGGLPGFSRPRLDWNILPA
jgi:lipopolysaccharide transport system ATP-binding protein